ncbi:IS21-like element helper ATPase IstB [Pectinatus frisingensis]|uniref:IS21-like element helper ATPase IstB n=1 Tax=Pectinatus frisingensis TaxID=865 RepID=UPI0018C71E20|nr:IS21-like element helper ATPase IstB [Pectinatus frisingensis]
MDIDPIREQIQLYARQLKLPTFTKYSDVLRRASSHARFDELLLELMKAESIQRQENQNRKRLKTAGFPYTKTLEELELSRYGGQISNVFVNELASCRFIGEKKNVVMIGNPGRGKTHMAIGIGLKACALGMSVLFKNAATLSTELAEAKDHYSLGKLEKRIRQASLLILDEMSYVSFDRFQSELLFKVVSDRSERGSIIVTTNLAFSQWTELFENTAMVAALVDRLTFKSYVLDMNGESYRLDQTLKAQRL